ncbi:MAG: asparagine synthase (glutamine-hydrolyzing) [Bacteroidota bacterium]|nr:asparagine synthase (glutamine-hydrolyzing) [Bacteroidota bacterium]
MCGIAGFIDLNKNSSQAVLDKCTDSLSHRGPDGRGVVWRETEEAHIGIGHRRLAVIDLSPAGHQPMWYKQFCITFNGEIYNYRELRTQLEALGHQFHTQSDTEVILHCWEEWKESMAGRFTGMFAFVIYDTLKKELIAFRDRLGVKPLYYYHHDGLFLFASELKSFHAHPGFEKQIHRPGLRQYLQYGYIMAPLTIFEWTRKLAPGHILFFSLENPVPRIQPYWDPQPPYQAQKLSISEPEAKKEMESLLIKACNYRMVADVPVGIFLSGGYDSTAITAILQGQQTEKLKTFTIGFYEESFNEARYAKRVADYLQTDHTEHYCTTREAQEIIPEIPFFCDEPFGDASIIPTTLVSRLARKEVTVSLSADGGDEMGGGYPKYPLAIDFMRRIQRIPEAMRPPAGKLLRNIPAGWLDRLMHNPAAGFKRDRISELMGDSRVTTVKIMDSLLSRVLSDAQIQRMMKDSGPANPPCFGKEMLQDSQLSQLDQMLLADYLTYLPDDILCKVDRASMSQSLESREPLLDHHLMEFAATLPDSLKIHGGQKKYLLKQIVHDYVPEELMERPKMGFGVPVAAWLRNDLKYLSEEYMNPHDFERHGLFNLEFTREIMQEFFSGNKNYEVIFWYLLIFQMWYTKWMD